MNLQKEYVLVAVCDGRAIPMKDVPNSIFSHKYMGEGIAFLPQGKCLVSPAVGIIKYIPETLHTIGITLENGLGIIIHLGLDEVGINGDSFRVNCEVGQKVLAGEVLIESNEHFAQSIEREWIIPLVITQHEDFGEFEFLLEGEIEAGVTEVVRYVK